MFFSLARRPDVEQQASVMEEYLSEARVARVIRLGLKDVGVHAELAPCAHCARPSRKERRARLRTAPVWPQSDCKACARSARVNFMAEGPASAREFCAAAQVSFREMRMVKTNHRRFFSRRRSLLPADLIRVARFD